MIQKAAIFNRTLATGLAIMAFISFWQLTVSLFHISTYILPGPYQVLQAFITYRSTIFKNALITITEAFWGFFIANLISVFIAIFISFHRRFENIIMPIAIWLKTMPVIALAPLLIIWFGPGIPSKVVAAVLVCFFPALINVLEGVKVLDIKLIWLFKVYAANNRQLIGKLIFPSILPYLFAAFKTSSSLAVVGALVGEFIGSNRGLGFLIMSNYYNMNTALVFAAISASSIIGISFYYVLDYFEKKTIFSENEFKKTQSQNTLAAHKYFERR